MSLSKGTLFGVSVGPGDPGLLTLRAVEVLREADCIAAPAVGSSRRMALSIVQDYLEGKQVIDCPTPMTRDGLATGEAYDAIANELSAVLDSGKTVAFVTLGDASVYSTWAYIQKRMEARGYDTQVIPGVPSFCAAAAVLGEPLCTGGEQLLVVPASSGNVHAALDVAGVKVFMKAGRKLSELQDALRQRSVPSALIAHCGLPDERVVDDFNAMDNVEGYMSVVIARDVKRSGPVRSGACSNDAHPGELRTNDAHPGELRSNDAHPGEQSADAPQPSSAFFQNRSCAYFPCHEGVECDRFNCLLCYCPLYALGDRCGGGFSYSESGVKDCSGCTLPHEGEDGVRMVKQRFAELAALARAGGEDG